MFTQNCTSIQFIWLYNISYFLNRELLSFIFLILQLCLEFSFFILERQNLQNFLIFRQLFDYILLQLLLGILFLEPPKISDHGICMSNHLQDSDLLLQEVFTIIFGERPAGLCQVRQINRNVFEVGFSIECIGLLKKGGGVELLQQLFTIICSLIHQYLFCNQYLKAMTQTKQDVINSWKQNNQGFYEYLYQNNLDYPCTSCQWGPVMTDGQQFTRQKIYFSCRTGGVYNQIDNSWKSTPNYIVVATVEIPNQDHYFINDLRSLFHYEQAKKHPNLKIKQVIMHPGQINVIRAFSSNRKTLATKNDYNSVFIWTPEKHKSTSNNHPHIPDITLLTAVSSIPNFSLVFTPTLPRVMSASGNKIQLFDLEGGGTLARRELGSVLSSSVIVPTLTLQIPINIKEKIEDISFKDRNNELCITGGQGRRIGMWDLRLGGNTNYIDGIHQSDINCLSWKNNYIISGGSDKRVNIIDERKTKTPLYTFQNKKEVLSIHWNSSSSHFAVGSDNLSIYNFSEIEGSAKIQPIFTHFGMRGSINDFDWNSENPWDIVSTCLELQPEVPAMGGYLHIFRPLDLLYMDTEKATSKLQSAFERLSDQKLKQYI